MAFDAKKFLKTKWTERTENYPVPDLHAFFPNGENSVWTVRGLTGQELGCAAEAAERNKSMAAIMEGLAGNVSKDKTDAVKDLLGIGGTVPADIAKRLEHLQLGSVNPVCPRELAVKLCEAFPIEFYQITNKIMELSGKGQLPGKQLPSGETVKSELASLSDTQEGVFCTN